MSPLQVAVEYLCKEAKPFLVNKNTLLLLGENLFEIFNKVQGKLSIEEICLIAIQA